MGVYQKYKTFSNLHELATERYFTARGYKVIRFGIEETCGLHHSLLLHHKSKGAKLFRHFPDFVVISDDSFFFVESKAGQFISRDAYESYLMYTRIAPVYLIVRKSEIEVYSGLIEKIRLQEAFDSETVSVVDKWAVPKTPLNRNGSGMPFRYFDFASMTFLSDFYA